MTFLQPKLKQLFSLFIACFLMSPVVSSFSQTDSLPKGMVLIPSGKFTMGKDSKKTRNYSPEHEVVLDAFFMDKSEVTCGNYLEFCKATNHKLPEFWGSDYFKNGNSFLNHPVVGINWYDANKYAEWAGKRLPTEAEWEYAARGGLKNKAYPRGDAWHREKAKQDSTGWKNLIHRVDTFLPNGYGLYGMAGNVWEWVADKYSYTYYAASKIENPKGPTDGSFRVIRGGSWHSGAMCKRTYYRKGLPGNWCDFAVGFRCVKDLNAKVNGE